MRSIKTAFFVELFLFLSVVVIISCVIWANTLYITRQSNQYRQEAHDLQEKIYNLVKEDNEDHVLMCETFKYSGLKTFGDC